LILICDIISIVLSPIRKDMLKHFFDFLSSIVNGGMKTGAVQKIDLTWGGAGNQVMTIDGVNYATWIDYKEWPKIGEVVKHKPYKEYYRGRKMLCTKIIKEGTEPI
jgi:hypothetical protein